MALTAVEQQNIGLFPAEIAQRKAELENAKTRNVSENERKSLIKHLTNLLNQAQSTYDGLLAKQAASASTTQNGITKTPVEGQPGFSLFSASGQAPNTITPSSSPSSGAVVKPPSPSSQGSSGSTQAKPVNPNEDGNKIIDASNYPDDVKGLFKRILAGYGGEDVNIENIIAEFEKLKSTTINPVFQEKANIFIDEMKRAGEYQQLQRNLELESEGVSADERVKSAQADFERRGLTFSGEAARQLGSRSAFTPHENIPFGGPLPEGLIPQQNRLIATSSEARAKREREQLQRQAETTLGTDASGNLIPGVSALGNVTGSLPFERAQTEDALLRELYRKELSNVQTRSEFVGAPELAAQVGVNQATPQPQAQAQVGVNQGTPQPQAQAQVKTTPIPVASKPAKGRTEVVQSNLTGAALVRAKREARRTGQAVPVS